MNKQHPSLDHAGCPLGEATRRRGDEATRRRRHAVASSRLCAILLAALLVGCATAAPPTPAPTPTSALLPIRPASTARLAEPAAPAPTVAAEGAALAGQLLFVQAGNLWLWQGETGHQLTSAGDAFQPAWSPDGQRIAYIKRTVSSSDLLVMPASGGEPLRLTEDGPDSSVYSYERIYASTWAFYPAWSPDGATIAYASQAGPPGGEPAAEFRLSLFAMPADGGRREQLYGDDSGHVGRLAYAPDGASIVFAYGPAGQGAPALHRYTRASGNAAPLPGAPAQSYDPAFSPDGRWLAFAARANGHTDIFAMLVGGSSAGAASASAPIQLTSQGAARAPAWSPDGTQIAFLAIAPGANSFDLWVVDLKSGPGGAPQPGQPRQITKDMALDADSGVAWGR
jgi:TolB protein